MPNYFISKLDVCRMICYSQPYHRCTEHFQACTLNRTEQNTKTACTEHLSSDPADLAYTSSTCVLVCSALQRTEREWGGGEEGEGGRMKRGGWERNCVCEFKIKQVKPLRINTLRHTCDCYIKPWDELHSFCCQTYCFACWIVKYI